MFSAHGMTLGKAIAEERLEHFTRRSQNAGGHLYLHLRMIPIVDVQYDVAEITDSLGACFEQIHQRWDVVVMSRIPDGCAAGFNGTRSIEGPRSDGGIRISHVATVAVAVRGCASVVAWLF